MLSLPEWQQVFAGATSLNHTLDVHLQAVVFDADVHLDNVVSGGTGTGPDVVVQSRKMLGYVQLKPSSILIPPRIFADLLRFQNGSLGGPVDCTVDIAKSKQRMRLSRVDVNPATERGREERVRERRARLPDSSAGRLVVGRAAAHRHRGREARAAAGDRAAHQAERQRELPDRASRGRPRARLERPLRRRAVDGHAEAALRRPAVHAGRPQAEERADLLRGRVQAAQLEGAVPERRERAGADERRAPGRRSSAKA